MLRILVQLSLLIWQVFSTGVRVFAYDSVKGGLLDMRPLERSNRAPIVIALVAIGTLLTATLLADRLRTFLAIEPLAIASTTTRGILVPTLAVPVTLVALVLAWTLILAGIVRMHIVFRILAIAAFLLFGAPALNDVVAATAPLTITAPLLAGALNIAAAVATLGLIAAVFLLHRHAHADWLDFLVVLALLTLVALPTVIGYAYMRRDAYDDPMGQADSLAGGLSLAVALLAPFRMISGLEMANLAATVTSWMMRAAWRHTGRAFAVVVLFAVLAARLASAITNIDFGSALPWGAWGGAALHIFGVALLVLVFRRRAPTDVESFGPMVWAIVAYVGFTIFMTPLMQAITSGMIAFGVVSRQMESAAAGADTVMRSIAAVTDAYNYYARLILAGGAAVAAVWMFRRRRTSASIVAALAWTSFTKWITSIERPLQALRWEHGHVDLLMMIVLAVVALWRLAQHRLNEATALRLLGVAIVFALLGQSSFLDNPFSPVAAVAGVLLLVAGITWNIVTSGGRFLNADSPAFPRWSRATSYFGYVLLSVTVAHWFVATHTVWQQALQSFMTESGFELFGYAVVWRLCIERGAALLEVDSPSDSL